MRKTILGSAALVLLALATAMPAHATLPGPNGKIAFQSNRAGTQQDIWTMNADGTGQTRVTTGTGVEVQPAWSPDGRDIAYVRQGNGMIVVIDANGNDPFVVTPVASDRRHPSWRPDGGRLAYQFQSSFIATTDLSGSGAETAVTEPPEEWITDWAPDWSPDGSVIAFERCFCFPDPNPGRRLWVVDSTGGNERELTSGLEDRNPSISPDGQSVVFERWGAESVDLYTVPLAGGTALPLTNTPGVNEWHPVWSPDGTKIAFTGIPDNTLNRDIYVINADGTGQQRLTTDAAPDEEPSWQRVAAGTNGYPRPKGATPIRVPLVPAYAQCTAPNRQHGPPLAFGSCAPPARASQYATVGTPDANGQPAQSSGFMLAEVIAGDPATPADEADVGLRMGISDVRHAGNAGSPYLFGLLAQLPFGITDKSLGCCDEPSTIAGTFDVFLELGCAAAPPAGATCAINTTAETLVPGAVREGKRSIWELASPVRVYDAGEDGHAGSTDDNTLFAMQGVFVP